MNLAQFAKEFLPIRLLLRSWKANLLGYLEKLTECCINLMVSNVLIGLVQRVWSIIASVIILAELKDRIWVLLQISLLLFEEMQPAHTGEQ